MKFQNLFRKITMIEILILVIFVIYLVLPVKTPHSIAPFIESPLGIVVIFLLAIFLFLYSNPILAVLFVFVAYELLRRSIVKLSPSVPNVSYVQYTPETVKRETEMNKANAIMPDPINPVNVKHAENDAVVNEPIIQLPVLSEHVSLEEEVVNKMAPIGKSEPVSFKPSGFHPVMDNAHSASFI